MPSFSALSPAKLNLFLHITGRRSDGYHTLQTVFQLLDWGDEMHFDPNRSGSITVDMPGLAIAPEQNLIVRAAQLLRNDDGQGVHIRVQKRIPCGGGLGGGSSNAATTLRMLNRLWQRELDNEALCALGTTLGADVPVFVAGHSAWAEGIGEVLTPMELPRRWYLIIKPNCQVATAEIFSHEQLTRDTAPITMAAFFRGRFQNDCQDTVRHLYPEVDKALKWLENFGNARLTGTGACVFASFKTESEAVAIARELPAQWAAYVARGVNHSPAPPVTV